MSLKIAILADLHLNIKNNHFFKNIQVALKNIIALLKENKVDIVFIAGDLFHTNGTIDIEALLESNEVIHELLTSFEVHMIPGNHDLIYREYKNKDNKVKTKKINILNNYNRSNKYIYNEYTYIEIGDTRYHFLPYCETINPNIFEYGEETNILISHLGVKDFYFDNFQVDDVSKITVKSFEKFNHVFLGHYHGFQEGNNITYVSSPYQMKHGDESSKHGFVIYDTGKKDYEFIENKVTPQFKTVDLKTKKDVASLRQIEGKSLRIIVRKKIDSNLINAIKKKLKEKNHSVDIKIKIDKDVKNNLAVVEGWKDIIYEDTETLLDQFADTIIDSLEFEKAEFLEALTINAVKIEGI